MAALAVVEAATLWEMLVRRVAATPDRTMLIDDKDQQVTFAEFLARAERVAAGLQAMGIGEGSVVSWQLPTRIDTVVLSMALSRLGAVQNPIIHLYREREVGSLLRTTGASLLACVGEWRGFDYGAMARTLQEASGGAFEILRADEGLPDGDPATLPPAPTDGDAVRWLYSTSGTTSEPKAVRHTDGTLIAGGTGLAMAMPPDETTVGTICFPYAHIGGPDYLVMMLRCGMPALLMEAFAPADAVALFNRHKVTTSGGSTAHYLAFLGEQAKVTEGKAIPSLRYLAGGGAPKPPAVFFDVQNAMGVRILHGYGMTECPMITSGAVGDTDEQLAYTDGAPVHGCEVRIVDDHGEPVPAGTEGEVLVRGPMLAKGYSDEALTAEAFRADGFFRTGDRGVMREDGHVTLTGRSKELIIRKGENISPKEIEDVLASHPSVGAVAVIGLADSERGERVCAVVETRPGAEPLTFPAMQQWCRDAKLMTQKIPEQLEVVAAMPRNPTMKILKRELVKQFSS